MKYTLLLTFLILTLTNNCYSNEYRISGSIKDKKSHETIAYANVWVKGSFHGIASNVDGEFSLEVQSGDTLCISSLGYDEFSMIITKPLSNLSISLSPTTTSINEVKVKPKEDYATVIFKRIIKHKRGNRKEISEITSLHNVNKTTIYLALDSSMQQRSLIEDLNEVSITREEDDIRYLPIYFSNEANEITPNNQQRLYNETEGIFPSLNQTINGIITQYLAVDIDIYKNNIYLLGKTFPSPISNNARMYYNIYVNDSTFINNEKHYNLSFAPKDKHASLFTGSFVVDSKQYAVKKMKLYFKSSANINFVRGFNADIAYKKDNEEALHMSRQNLMINLAVFGSSRTDSTYASDRVNDISSGDWMLNKQRYYSLDSTLQNTNAEQWKEHPDFDIEAVKTSQYEMVDKIKQQPKIKIVDAIGSIALTSYYKGRLFDVGPVYSIYSTNAIEGHRFSVPLRTNENLFENFTVGGYVGYGSKNNEFKFGGNFGWQPLKSDKLVFRFLYDNDYNIISQDKFLRFIKKNPNTKGNGNFVAALTTQVRDKYLKEEKRIEFRTEYNTDRGVTFEASPYVSKSISTPEVQFIRNGISHNDYINYGALFNCRIAFNQYFEKEYFARIYYQSQVPIINLSMDIGKVSTSENDEDYGMYYHLHGSVQGIYSMGVFTMRYMLNGGVLFGDAPYELLDMPVGSRSWGFAKYRYNLLHHATFAHNVYANLHLEGSGGGFILNKVPLIKRLQLREMISFKSHYGTRNNMYDGVFDLPNVYEHNMTYPYAELGLGITNLFKVIRVEYVRQIGDYYREENLAQKHGVRLRAEMSF